jgi:hypothetical protein
VFSNRYFRLKLAGALLLIALQGVYSGRKGESINPLLWRCVAQPERWRDKTLLMAAVIVSTEATGFEIESGHARIRVDGTPPGKVHDAVFLTAIFRADGPRLEMIGSRPMPVHYRLRWLVEAVSVVVLLGVLANFARHFAFRPKVLQLEKAP